MVLPGTSDDILIDRASTDSSGYYIFVNLQPGVYYLPSGSIDIAGWICIHCT